MELIDRRSLGLSGVDISRVGLGGYELGPEPGEEPDVDRAERVIKTAVANGVWIRPRTTSKLETCTMGRNPSRRAARICPP